MAHSRRRSRLSLVQSTTLVFAFLAIVFKNLPSCRTFSLLSTNAYDRFRASCPANPSSIFEFDPSLVDITSRSENGKDVWVAVFRSKNNMPSVYMRDGFFGAMDIATKVAPGIETTAATTENAGGVMAPRPVAIARLCPSTSDENEWMIDTMRCSLKKEDMNDDCDGGSEHLEALSICIDELILRHLETQKNNKIDEDEDGGSTIFDGGALVCKATLVSAPLLLARGFSETEVLRGDMATHVSSLDSSMEAYADRVAGSVSDNVQAKSPGSRDRALKILSLLGQLDRIREKRGNSAGNQNNKSGTKNDGSDDYDPFANIYKFC